MTAKHAAPPPSNPLLGLAGQITEEHLTELEAEIDAAEKRLAGLKKLHRVGLAFLGRSPPKNSRAKTTPARVAGPPAQVDEADLLEKRKKVAAFLAKNGARNGRDIILNCGIQPAKLSLVVNHPWFTNGVQGYHVTPEARRAALE